jgi:hypothetical protein
LRPARAARNRRAAFDAIFRVFTPAPPGQKFDPDGAHIGALYPN